jgi:cold shock CspA family protein
MQRFTTVFHILYALLFAAAGICALLSPTTLLGTIAANSAYAVSTSQVAGFGLLLAAGIAFYCALREQARSVLHPLLCVYLLAITVSYTMSPASPGVWAWLAFALYLLPLLALLPIKLPAGPLKAGQLQGEVKWFNPNKGYGFILSDEGEEIFVHFRAVQNGGRRSLRQGQKVRFSIRQSERGDQADAVEILD